MTTKPIKELFEKSDVVILRKTIEVNLVLLEFEVENKSLGEVLAIEVKGNKETIMIPIAIKKDRGVEICESNIENLFKRF